MSRIFRFIGLGVIAAMALSIVGGIDQASTTSASNHAKTYIQVGAILFAVVYVLLAVMHIVCWSYQYQIRSSHRAVRVFLFLFVCLSFLGDLFYFISSSFLLGFRQLSPSSEFASRTLSSPHIRRLTTSLRNLTVSRAIGDCTLSCRWLWSMSWFSFIRR